MVTLLAFDAQEAGGRTLANASLHGIYGSLRRTRISVLIYVGRRGSIATHADVKNPGNLLTGVLSTLLERCDNQVLVLATVARARLLRSRRGAVDMADSLGTKLTHATLIMSTSASESSGRPDAIEADIAACCRKGVQAAKKE